MSAGRHAAAVLAGALALATATSTAAADGVFYDVELLRFTGRQGAMTQLRAQRAWQLPGTDHAFGLAALQLRGRDARGAPWRLSAPQGEAHSGDALQLRGGVVWRGRGADGAELQLSTPQLRWALKRQRGSGDGLLELRWGHSRLRGRGFEFSISEQWLQVLHDTQTWIAQPTAATATATRGQDAP